MKLVKSHDRDDSRPEVVTLEFPDEISRGVDNTLNSPREEWIYLAKETGLKLNIPLEIRKTETGLSAAFLSEAQATKLMAAMSEDWHERLIKSLAYNVMIMELERMDWEAGRMGEDYTPKPWREQIIKMAEEYGVDPKEIWHYDGSIALDAH